MYYYYYISKINNNNISAGNYFCNIEYIKQKKKLGQKTQNLPTFNYNLYFNYVFNSHSIYVYFLFIRMLISIK